MTNDDVDILSVQRRYEGFLKIDEYRLRHRLFAGGWSPVIAREMMERGHAVCAALYDPTCDMVVLIEQFRIGAYAGGSPAWLVECVAGMITKGEDPVDVVRREITEETGLSALDILPAGRAFASPGGTSEIVEMFIARVDSSKAGGIHGLAHEGEDIRVLVEPFDDAVAAFFDGRRIGNSFTLMTLQWLALNRTRLLEKWEIGI